MADRKISDLTALTTPASGDFLPIVDISEVAAASKNKRITIEELMRGMPDGTAAAPGIAFETDPNTGIYSPGADQLAVATNGTGRLFVDASGRVGVGTSAPRGDVSIGHAFSTAYDASLHLGYAAIDHYGFRLVNTNTASSTAAGLLKFQRGNLSGWVDSVVIDNSGNVGIGTTSPTDTLNISSSANQIGLDTGNQATYGTLDIGHFSNGAFIGTQAGSDAASNLLRFGTSGTERARIDSSGRLLVGTSTARSNFVIGPAGYAGTVQHETGSQPFFTIVGGNTSAGGPYLILGHQRSGAVGGNTVLVSGDELGTVSFHGSDGANLIVGARIEAAVDGTPGANDMPGRLVFSTTADGAATPTERMRITSTGQVRLAGAGITFNGDTAAANELDDYEEGTYSPSIDNWSGTYTTQLGQYVKIGKKVYAAGRIITTGGSGSFADFLSITMPFTGSTSITSPNFGTWTIVGGTTGVPSSVVAGGPLGGPISNAVAFMNTFNTGGNSGNWSAAYCDASVACEFRFHCTYFV